MSALGVVTEGVSLLVEALDVIESITKNATVEKADEAFHAILAVLQSVKDGTSGKITPEAVKADLAILAKNIAANDAAADADLAAKFPKG